MENKDDLNLKYTQIEHRVRLSDEIFEQIKSLIFSGKIKPGERLPNERDLSLILNVGRPSLREALTQLTRVGLIENKRQKGYFVRSVLDVLIDPLKNYLEYEIKNLIDFMQVRKVLDVMTAKEAIRKGNRQDFLKIKENIGKGYEFHVSIAEATHNLIFIHVISSMHQILSTLSYIKHGKEGSQINAAEQHQSIYDAIISKSNDKVEKAIDVHIESFTKEAREKYLILKKYEIKGGA